MMTDPATLPPEAQLKPVLQMAEALPIPGA
jgi:hypothetical protein